MNMVLYHASQVSNLKVIKPQRTLSNDKYIGDYVFATKNQKMALMYLVPKGIATLMNPDDDHPSIVICHDKSDFLKRDKGGAIYALSGDNFAQTPQGDLSDYEMVCESEAIPLKEINYPSVLEALMSSGIKVRFTDKKTFESLIGNPNQKNIIESLEIYEP